VILPETGQTCKLPADIFSWSVRYRLSLVFTLRASSAAQCIVIGPVCGCNGRAGGVRTLLQPARAQCARLSECFFIVFFCFVLSSQRHISYRREDTNNNHCSWSRSSCCRACHLYHRSLQMQEVRITC